MNLMAHFQAPQSQPPVFQQQQAPTPQQQPAQQPAQAPRPDPQLGGQPSGPGSQVQQGQNAPQQQQPAGGNPPQNTPNGLDNFTNLFKNDPKNPTSNPWDFISTDKPLIANDFDALKSQVDNAQFAPQVTPEHMQRIMQGDVQALSQLLNQTAQAAFLQAARFGHGMVENGIQTYHGRLGEALPHRITDVTANAQLLQDNPTFAHEAARPVVEAVRAHVANQMPGATPQQIATKTAEYLRMLSGNPQSQNTPQTGIDPLTGQPTSGRKQLPATNWNSWFEGK